MHIKEHDNVYIIENETWVRFTQMREGYDLFYNVSCGHGQQPNIMTKRNIHPFKETLVISLGVKWTYTNIIVFNEIPETLTLN